MRNKILALALLVIVSLLALAFVFPLYWMAIGSFEKISTVVKFPPDFFPKDPTLRNYSTLFTKFPLLRWLLNSLLVSSCVAIISVSTSCLAGYAFAKKEFLGKNFLFWMLLSTIMIPFYVTIIPLFMSMKKWGLYNSYPAMFLPMVCYAAFIFLARQYMSIVPSELLDAAKIDGASELGIFVHVVIPLSKPLIAALAIFSFVNSWRRFLWPLIVTSSNQMRTLPVAVATVMCFPGGHQELGLAMAGTTLMAAPVTLMFIFFQKYFVRGITMGSLKG